MDDQDDRRYFEDLTVGERVDLGGETLTEAGIVAFARRWDPLPFHVDPAAAERSHGGLIASGYHTLCLTARLAVEGFRSEVAAVAGLGIDSLSWARPVRPGDRLECRLEVIGKRPSESRPDAGVFRESVVGRVDGEVAIRYEDAALIERR
jgi:acyl dehydratase